MIRSTIWRTYGALLDGLWLAASYFRDRRNPDHLHNEAISLRPTTAGALVVVLSAVAIIGIFLTNSAPSAPIGAPARLTYTLAYDDGSGGDLERTEFVLGLRSWSDWRQEVTCCETLTGYVQEQRADGSIWSGYESRAAGIIETHRGSEGDSSVPLPDFAQGRPYTRAEMAAFLGVNLDDATASRWAADLGLDAGSIIAYRTASEIAGIEGFEPAIDTEGLYVVDSSMHVPVHIEEFQDGRLIRSLTLTGVSAST